MLVGRGVRGMEARMAEITARLDQRFGVKEARMAFPDPAAPNPGPSSGLSGSIAGGMIGRVAGGLSPLAPFGPSTSVPGLNQAPAGGVSAFRPLIEREAQSAGIDADLLHALIQAESGGNPMAVSSAGAQGLTQLMPGTARGLGVTDPFNPEQSVRGGARYLGQMLRQFPTVEQALAAYNAGPGRVARAGGIPANRETPEYVRRVMETWQNLKAR